MLVDLAVLAMAFCTYDPNDSKDRDCFVTQVRSCIIPTRDKPSPLILATVGHRLKRKGLEIASGQSLLAGRYRLVSIVGEGAFSTTYRAVDELREERTVAIKKLHKKYNEVGLLEARVLKYLSTCSGSHDSTGVLGIESSILSNGVCCLVLPLLATNLSRYTSLQSNTIGRGGRTSIKTIRSLAQQLLTALAFLSKNGVIHADLKTDNILLAIENNFQQEGRCTGEAGGGLDALDQAMTAGSSDVVLKLCDFGSAHHTTETRMYADNFDLQTLAYRAPEITLGCSYGVAIDTYSAGVSLLELVLGRPLFHGPRHGGVCCRKDLVAHTACALAPIPKEVFQNGLFYENIFGDTNKCGLINGCCSCCWLENTHNRARNDIRNTLVSKRQCTGRCASACTRLATPPLSEKEILPVDAALGFGLHRLMEGMSGTVAPSWRRNPKLIALLQGLLVADPRDRLSPEEALKHPFFTSPLIISPNCGSVSVSPNIASESVKASASSSVQSFISPLSIPKSGRGGARETYHAGLHEKTSCKAQNIVTQPLEDSAKRKWISSSTELEMSSASCQSDGESEEHIFPAKKKTATSEHYQLLSKFQRRDTG